MSCGLTLPKRQSHRAAGSGPAQAPARGRQRPAPKVLPLTSAAGVGDSGSRCPDAWRLPPRHRASLGRGLLQHRLPERCPWGWAAGACPVARQCRAPPPHTRPSRSHRHAGLRVQSPSDRRPSPGDGMRRGGRGGMGPEGDGGWDQGLQVRGPRGRPRPRARDRAIRKHQGERQGPSACWDLWLTRPPDP